MADSAFIRQIVSVMKECVVSGGIQPNAVPVTIWSRLVHRVRAWFEVPYGYEDENGFHYGHEPVPEWFSQSPTAASGKILTDRACDVMKYPVALPIGPEEDSTQPKQSPASIH